MHFDLDKLTVAGIPLLTLAQAGLRRAPVVIYVHGFTGDKSQGMELGYRLAERGLLFVAPDAPMHGERLAEPMTRLGEAQGKLYPPECGLDTFFMMYEIIAQAVSELPALLDHLDADSRADGARVGICGVSMGGLVSFMAAARLERIRAAAPMLAYPSFAQRWQDVVSEASSYPQWSECLSALADESARRLDYMRAIDPEPRLPDFAPRPLMMVSGERDVDAPKLYNTRLFQALLPAYVEHPGRLQLRIYDGVDHRVTKEMNADVSDFFAQHL